MSKQTTSELHDNLIDCLLGIATDNSCVAWQQLIVARRRLSTSCKAEVQTMFVIDKSHLNQLLTRLYINSYAYSNTRTGCWFDAS